MARACRVLLFLPLHTPSTRARLLRLGTAGRCPPGRRAGLRPKDPRISHGHVQAREAAQRCPGRHTWRRVSGWAGPDMRGTARLGRASTRMSSAGPPTLPPGRTRAEPWPGRTAEISESLSKKPATPARPQVAKPARARHGGDAARRCAVRVVISEMRALPARPFAAAGRSESPPGCGLRRSRCPGPHPHGPRRRAGTTRSSIAWCALPSRAMCG